MAAPEITKLSPFAVVAQNALLAGTVAQIGVPVCVAGYSRAAVDVAYAANGGGGTGSPIIAVDLSRSPSTVDPATITDWRPVQILDGSTFAAGSVASYVEQIKPVSPAGAGTGFSTSWPDIIDVSCHFWLRVRVGDTDAALPGSVSVYCGASVGG